MNVCLLEELIRIGREYTKRIADTEHILTILAILDAIRRELEEEFEEKSNYWGE